MKTTIQLTVFLVAMLLECGAAPAQIAPPTAQSVAPTNRLPGEKDTSFVMANPSGSNFYIEGGLALLNTDMHSKIFNDKNNFWGGTLALGWRINANSKMHIEMNILEASCKKRNFVHTSSYPNPVILALVTTERTYVAAPVLFAYSYCIPLTSSRRWELRLSPAAGTYTLGITEERRSSSSSYRNRKTSKTATGFAAGAGIGVMCHINKHFYLDSGYRILGVSSIDYGDKYFGKLDSQTTHSLAVSFGWKF